MKYGSRPFSRPDALEKDGPRFFVDADHLGHVAFSAGDAGFQFPRGCIVEIEMPPVVALGEPDHFVRCGEILPVHPAVAGFEEGLDVLLEHFADLAGKGVGEAHLLLAMSTRGGYESEVFGIVGPLNVGPFAAAAGDVVAEGGAVLIRRHLDAHDLRAVDINNDALNHGHVRVAGEGIFPGFEFRMPDLGVDQIHFADLALVLLKGRDLFGIGRPGRGSPDLLVDHPALSVA